MAFAVLEDMAVEHLMTCQVNGVCLHGAIYIPFGDIKTLRGSFPAQQYGDVKLKLTGGAGVAPTRVVLQQIRR